MKIDKKQRELYENLVAATICGFFGHACSKGIHIDISLDYRALARDIVDVLDNDGVTRSAEEIINENKPS